MRARPTTAGRARSTCGDGDPRGLLLDLDDRVDGLACRDHADEGELELTARQELIPPAIEQDAVRGGGDLHPLSDEAGQAERLRGVFVGMEVAAARIRALELSREVEASLMVRAHDATSVNVAVDVQIGDPSCAIVGFDDCVLAATLLEAIRDGARDREGCGCADDTMRDEALPCVQQRSRRDGLEEQDREVGSHRRVEDAGGPRGMVDPGRGPVALVRRLRHREPEGTEVVARPCPAEAGGLPGRSSCKPMHTGV